MSLYLAYTNPLLGHVYPTVPTLVELRLTQRTKASLDAAAAECNLSTRETADQLSPRFGRFFRTRPERASRVPWTF